MAESFNVNLTITSAVGFRRPDLVIRSPRPIMTTTYTLNGDIGVDPDPGIVKRLSMSQPEPFELFPGGVSEPQVVSLTNEGNTDITIVFPFFRWSLNGPLPILDVEPGSLLDESPAILPVGSTGTFTLAYSGDTSGIYSNWFIVVTDADVPQVKVITTQTVFDNYYFDITPSSGTYTITDPADSHIFEFDTLPIINATERPDVQWSMSATIASLDQGWTVESTGINFANAKFDPVGFNNGVFTATLTIIGYNDITRNVNLTTVVDVDYETQYIYHGSWVSAPGPGNSIIGISYDTIAGDRTITIGVGVGGSGTKQLSEGGIYNATTSTINFLGAAYPGPYSGWANVFRIPMTSEYGTPATYYSGDLDAEGNSLYKVKSTDGLNYDEYFGVESYSGSMFIVTDDGYRNITIKMNLLREVTDNLEFNKTLEYLHKAFYYYLPDSERTSNLSPGPVLDGTVTDRFSGFNNSGTVITNIVSLP
jgi:hypothetical protein